MNLYSTWRSYVGLFIDSLPQSKLVTPELLTASIEVCSPYLGLPICYVLSLDYVMTLTRAELLIVSLSM